MASAKEYYAKWYAANAERRKAVERARYAAASDQIKRRTNAWRMAHPEQVRAYVAKWKVANRGRVLATANRRRAALLQRTPLWMNAEAILFWYECKPAGCEVDHIIPLQGKKVSGLHVENNLQWLPASVNARKGNSFCGAA